ncbi:MAG: hypothetical protein RL442_41 [Pseudomonadota bacterium]|jgi:hypothetical protein
MRTTTTLFSTFALSACTTGITPPMQSLVIDKELQGMSRNEVISAINECEVNNTRAVMVYAKRKISGHTADVVADVTCAPTYFSRRN